MPFPPTPAEDRQPGRYIFRGVIGGIGEFAPGGTLRYGKVRFSSTTEGFWLGVEADEVDANPKAKFHIGSTTDYIKYDGDVIKFGGDGEGLTSIDGGKIKTGTITANAIAADAIEADKIKAGAVTATKINVTKLNAVSTYTGDLTVDDELVVNATGSLEAGPVHISNIGVDIVAETTWTNNNAIRWHDASGLTNYVAMINAHSQATPDQRHTLELRSWPKSSHQGAIVLDCLTEGSDALIQLLARDSDGHGSGLWLTNNVGESIGDILMYGHTHCENLYVAGAASFPAASHPPDGSIFCTGRISTDDGTTRWELGDYTTTAPTVTGYVTVWIEGEEYRLACRHIT